ncbi:penicillin-binding transpeptidase domain-containing protein [Streptomyces sp. P17]|uniref:penicillin-binding transpeptidase domain-containing protein n=1 Tax=Streptomyces sp. P17 TaxID=3074716 RepID=UPI0037DCE263
MVSTPSYDPSVFVGSSSEHADAWKKLQADKNDPLLNRALRETCPPGSTLKVVTAAAVLENDLYTSVEDPTDTPEPWTLPETTTRLNNQGDVPCENASLKAALQHSCNTVFAKIGSDLGSDRTLAQAEEFGFGSEHLVPLRANSSVYPAKTNRSQNALSAIGQYNTRATPLQMAMVAAAVANDGTLMRPYLVRAAPTDSQATEPKVLSHPMSEATARKLQQMMRAVVDSGTGTDAAITDVEVGGKPGVAQTGTGNSESPYSWFISYAKAESAESASVAVAAVVQDAEPDRAAAPIARKVMEAVLDE